MKPHAIIVYTAFAQVKSLTLVYHLHAQQMGPVRHRLLAAQVKSLTLVYQLHAQQMKSVRHRLLAAAPDL